MDAKGGLIVVCKGGRFPGVQIELTEDFVAGPNQNYHFRLNQGITYQIVPGSRHVGNVLVGGFRYCSAADALTDGNLRVLCPHPDVVMKPEFVPAFAQHVDADPVKLWLGLMYGPNRVAEKGIR